ncbi:hypothetical protein EIP91_004016 [Steccherinum ochraceum]|uniref:Uncharacterized protein n=1 Tax=Steccherinum ochraceum TaxID=92696 RepID=A0A4R0R9L1_9APHY|nr:hypothetical protein EIP91_004016 [Steccherinum ochraceum]
MRFSIALAAAFCSSLASASSTIFDAAPVGLETVSKPVTARNLKLLEARVVPLPPKPVAQPPVSRPSTSSTETTQPSVNRPPYSIDGRELTEYLVVRDLLDEIFS